jgi:hypothetical protein
VKFSRTPPFYTKSISKKFLVPTKRKGYQTMKIKDCYQCAYNHWGIGIGVGVACVHPDNQKYNPKRRKEGEEKNYHNSTTQVSRIPDGCELRKERDR